MFHEEKLKEELLVLDPNGFSLHFHFGAEAELKEADSAITLPNNIMVTHHTIQQNSQPMAMAS
jgi:hypothetical protein